MEKTFETKYEKVRQTKFHDISFEDFLAGLQGALYYYTIEIDLELKIIDLSIYGSSLSELDDEDTQATECYLRSFSYSTKKEVHEDLKTAASEYKMEFEKKEESD